MDLIKAISTSFFFETYIFQFATSTAFVHFSNTVESFFFLPREFNIVEKQLESQAYFVVDYVHQNFF